jgi:UDP-galactopyranose mutase
VRRPARNRAIFARYRRKAARATEVTFVGRPANYRHFTLDEATRNAWTCSGRRSSTTTTGVDAQS